MANFGLAQSYLFLVGGAELLDCGRLSQNCGNGRLHVLEEAAESVSSFHAFGVKIIAIESVVFLARIFSLPL